MPRRRLCPGFQSQRQKTAKDSEGVVQLPFKQRLSGRQGAGPDFGASGLRQNSGAY